LGRTINYQVSSRLRRTSGFAKKTADIERKATLFVLLSDPALRQPYEQQSYENTRASFKQALSELLKLRLDNKIRAIGQRIIGKGKI